MEGGEGVRKLEGGKGGEDGSEESRGRERREGRECRKEKEWSERDGGRDWGQSRNAKEAEFKEREGEERERVREAEDVYRRIQ